MPTIVRGQPTSAEVRARLKSEDRTVLVAFSGGKDALATTLALKDEGIPVELAYLYGVPGVPPLRTLGFIEQGLSDLGTALGQEVHRYPHPSLYRWLNALVLQPPERCAIIEAAQLPTPTYEETWGLIKQDLGLPANTWVADGVRAADSIVRRASFTRHGVMKPHLHKVSPIYDWLKGEVMGRIEEAGIALPIDYEWFGRSFDGLDYRFIKPIRDNAPEDYQRILDWFPLAELEIMRYETE